MRELFTGTYAKHKARFSGEGDFPSLSEWLGSDAVKNSRMLNVYLDANAFDDGGGGEGGGGGGKRKPAGEPNGGTGGGGGRGTGGWMASDEGGSARNMSAEDMKSLMAQLRREGKIR